MLFHNDSKLNKLINGIKWCCQPRYRKYLLFRGYRRLRYSSQANLIQKCKYELSLAITGVNKQSASPDIFFSAQTEADLVIRQYLTKRTGEKSICLSIYNAVGGGIPIHHLPPHTYQILQNLSIPNWAFGSWLRWQISLILYWLYGCMIFFKLARSTASKKTDQCSHKTVFFLHLPLNAIPRSETVFQRQDLISWYVRWKRRNPSCDSISHQHKNCVDNEVCGMSLKYRAAGWPSFFAMHEKFGYFFWGVRISIMALFDIFRGRWWHALLFSQAVMAKRIALSQRENLPAEIWVNHENYKYKPVWVYEAEAKGVKSFLYFYSINNQTVQPATHEISISGYWHLMNWPRYLIWNEEQKNILKEYIQHKAEFVMSGALPFTDSDDDLSPLSSPAIAVFDIPSFTSEFFLLFGQAFKYQTDNVVEQFYQDVIHAAKANYFLVCTKQKAGRKSTHLTSRYIKLHDKLKKTKGVCGVKPDIAAHRLIMSTQMTISAPYSSTSLIAKSMGKPSCYYDPTMLLPDRTKFSHGVEIVKSLEALTEWIKKNKVN